MLTGAWLLAGLVPGLTHGFVLKGRWEGGWVTERGQEHADVMGTPS